MRHRCAPSPLDADIGTAAKAGGRKPLAEAEEPDELRMRDITESGAGAGVPKST